MQSRTQKDVHVGVLYGGVTEITVGYPDFSKTIKISKNSLLHNNFTISNNKIGWVVDDLQIF